MKYTLTLFFLFFTINTHTETDGKFNVVTKYEIGTLLENLEMSFDKNQVIVTFVEEFKQTNKALNTFAKNTNPQFWAINAAGLASFVSGVYKASQKNNSNTEYAVSAGLMLLGVAIIASSTYAN